MSIISDYDYFFLPADNLDKAKDFYKKKLGLYIKFDFSERGMVAFNVGDNQPAIILRKADHINPAILFRVDNVSKAYEKLNQKGVAFLSEPFGNKFGLTDYSKMSHLRG